ncbi:MAG TPA: cupin domain-containing protein [Terriglobales bacterium]|nr:cupin domain-containing protein [Terriglobales bacterium]
MPKNTKKKRPVAREQKRVALNKTVSTRKSKSELRHLPWDSVEREVLTPLFERQLIVGEQVMLARILLRKGCVVPLHSHVNEQLSSILEGALKFWIDDKEIVVRAGEVLTIPPNMPHKAEALEDTLAIDTFHPPRADWINKTDSYLRK